MKRCTRCIISESFPGSSFNEHGICNVCQKTPAVDDLLHKQRKLKFKMESLFDSVKNTSIYDCIVAFSGGKDSTYTLLKLTKEYNLNCLAITINNGFLSEQAVKNCNTITSNLGTDFIYYTPSSEFMLNMYKKSTSGEMHTKAAIKRASSICSSCINLINNYMMRTALEKQVPLIAGGYIGGQVPKDTAIINLNLLQHNAIHSQTVKNYAKAFGISANKYFAFDNKIIENYKYDSLHVLNPMLALPVSESEILSIITEIGWIKPLDTGQNSSNCLLNDLGIAIHHKKYNFNPYEAELADQVRNGLMKREDAIKKVQSIPDFRNLKTQADKIGLNLNDF